MPDLVQQSDGACVFLAVAAWHLWAVGSEAGAGYAGSFNPNTCAEAASTSSDWPYFGEVR